jgi:hypothetical protein
MNIGALFFLAVFGGAMGVYWFLGRRGGKPNLRDIPAFYRMRGAVELAVEDGSRIHLSIGSNDITSPQSGISLIGLSLVRQIATVASDSDLPPVTTMGNGMLAILAQDTLRAAYNSLGLGADFDNSLARITGLTPFAFAAGVTSVMLDEEISANIISGSFHDELAVITTTANRAQILTLGGTDTLSGQAVAYASVDYPLIGEEVFASVAYLNDDPLHVASLHAQDVVRWIVIGLLTLGALGGLFGGLGG